MATTLAAGDIAIIGYSSDAGTTDRPGKSFAFISFVPLDAGTVITFTDNGWKAAGGFTTTEGYRTYTVPAGGLAAGTVVTISGLTGSLNPSASGDSIIAFQGPADASATPLFAIDFADNNTGYAADATNSNTTAVPSWLTLGSTALAFGPDNGAYTGPTSGTPDALRTAIANPSNWTTNDVTPQLYASGFDVRIDGPAAVTVADVSITEGDAGTQILTFTITRSNTSSAFTVDYATRDGTAEAGSDYLAAAGTLRFAAGGPATQTVEVVIQGDGVVEPNQTFNLVLSNLVVQSGGARIADDAAVGTIVNDDVPSVAIYDIQGAGHASAYVGQQVRTQGVVTAVDNAGGRGFWIQDAQGDGNVATSDAVFVFTNAAVTVQVGELVQVAATVGEFRGSHANNLTITQLTAPTIQVIGTGTIEAIVLGAGGRTPPTETIDDDGRTLFNPETDGIDFYESLEGMLVTLPDARAVAPSEGGSVWVVGELGAGATGMNERGGITVSEGDFNPERVQLYFDGGVLPGVLPTYALGDRLGSVTGVVHYFGSEADGGGNFEVVVTKAPLPGSGRVLDPETTELQGDGARLELASYNVENLDPLDPAAKFDALAEDITDNLGWPDIISLIEVQDADGPGRGANLSGAATAAKLIDAIVAAGGPAYVYVEVAPTAAGISGGEPGGNIRNGFLYNPLRVDYVDGSARRIADTDSANGDAFAGSRMPLAAEFEFHGERITAVSVHNTSRGGSDSLFGATQPPSNAGDQKRIDQTAAINDFLAELYAQNPDAHVAVMGDFNAFDFETTLTQLETVGGLTNLGSLLPAAERYTYLFDGNFQQLDHLLVSAGLTDQAEFDIVHLNTGMSGYRPTDHDALISVLYVNTAPVSRADAYFGSEDTAVIVGGVQGLLANDTDKNGDALTVELVSGPANGLLTLNADGSFTYTGVADFNGRDSFIYVTRDAYDEVSEAVTVTLEIAAVNDRPTGEADAAAVLEDGSVLISALLNDSDKDGVALSIELAGGRSALGATVTVEDGRIRYVADADSFDLLRPGQSVTDTLTYRVSDGQGGLSEPVTVTVTVTEAADGRMVFGTNKADAFRDTLGGADTVWMGGNGDDTAFGGGGGDVLNGENGRDVLDGGAGVDHLAGGTGEDLLTGGLGADVFIFARNSGRDTVTDFNAAEDQLVFEGARSFSFRDLDLDRDGTVDAVLIHAQSSGDVVLLGWSVDALMAEDLLTQDLKVAGDWILG